MELAAFEKCCDDIVLLSDKDNVNPDAVAEPKDAARKEKSSVPPTKSAGAPEQKKRRSQFQSIANVEFATGRLTTYPDITTGTGEWERHLLY